MPCFMRRIAFAGLHVMEDLVTEMGAGDATARWRTVKEYAKAGGGG